MRVVLWPAAGGEFSARLPQARGVFVCGALIKMACGAQRAALAVAVRAWWLRLSLLEEGGVGVCFRSAVCLTGNGSTAPRHSTTTKKGALPCNHLHAHHHITATAAQRQRDAAPHRCAKKRAVER